MDLLIVGISFVLLLSVVCYSFRPFGLPDWIAALAGAAIAALVLVFELRVRAH